MDSGAGEGWGFLFEELLEGGGEFGDGANLDFAVVDLCGFGLDLDLAFGEGGGSVGGLLAGVLEGHVDLAVDGEDHLVADGVDVDGVPFAVRAFFGGAVLGVSGVGGEGAFWLPFFTFSGGEFEVGGGAGEGDEVTDISFLHLAFEGALPDVPEGSVGADAVEEDAGVALVLKTRLPFFFTPFGLEGEVVVLVFFLGGESGVDLAGDLENGVAVFLDGGEDVEGVDVEAEGGAFHAVWAGGGGVVRNGDGFVRDTHPDVPVAEA